MVNTFVQETTLNLERMKCPLSFISNAKREAIKKLGSITFDLTEVLPLIRGLCTTGMCGE